MKKYDVLVGMSQNFRMGNGKKKIEKSSTHLSYFSQEVSIACATLFLEGASDFILFTGGFTTKFSESEWMKKFTLDRFPQIKPEQIIIEEKSIDTSTSIKETMKIIQDKGFKNVGVVATSFHRRRTIHFFRRFGLDLKNEDFYNSYDIVSKVSDESRETARKENNSWHTMIEKYIKEPALSFGLIFDPDGRIAQFVTKRSRKG